MRRKKSIRWTCPAAAILIIVAPFTAVAWHTVLGYVLVMAALLFFVKVTPFCRKRENLYMFFLVAICSVPLNISLIFRYIRIGRLLWGLLSRSLAYLLLLSIEEIVMGYITRRLWTCQYRLPYSEQNAE